MWALRRASDPFKKGFTARTYRFCQAPSEISRYNSDCHKARVFEPTLILSDKILIGPRCYNSANDYCKLFTGVRSFSSQTGTRSTGEEDDDLEDGFSELETSAAAEANQKSDVEDESISEAEISEEDSNDYDIEGPQDEQDLTDTETDFNKKKLLAKRTSFSELFKVILASPPKLSGSLDKWVEEGNEVTRLEIFAAMFNLRKRRMYSKALQLSEWLESTKQIEFNERDYASRVDLIAKVHGAGRAEKYIQKIPQSFRTEVVYRTLLANYAAASNVKKSEETFNKMKDLGFPVSCFSCNQLLLLYKRTDKKKIADLLLLMEKENVKPSLFTYRLLIDVKGQYNDLNGMDQIVETMKTEGIEPDLATLATIARHYIGGGLKEKAEAVLKEMEGDNIKENRRACQFLLPLYAGLEEADEVRRIWQVCESNPRSTESMAAIEAWGKLGNVEEAEDVFEKMATSFKKLSSKQYSVLLKVYANKKMLARGKDLVKRMADSGCHVGPLVWDALVRLYVEAGEVEKADSVLLKAAEQSRVRPMFSSYMALMDQYSRRGDVHNAEKVFKRMRLAGYVGRLKPFQSLAQAYINAKRPAYGIYERMKAENIFPNKALMEQFSKIDPFKKTAVSDLLD